MRNVFTVAACFLAALTCSALPGNLSPRTGKADSFAFVLVNDAMGLGPVDEWDDLRTFGLVLAAESKTMLGLTTEYQSYTWRSDSPSTALRIDSLAVFLTGRLLDASPGAVRFVSRGRIGASLFGDLGGFALQERYHGTVSIGRPVPVSYDEYSSAALAVSLSAEASLRNGILRPAAFASVDGDFPGSWRVQAGARADLGGPGSCLAAWMLYRHESRAGLSPTLDAVSRMASGAVAGLEVDASFLTCSTEFNFSTGTSTGALGIRIAAGGPGEAAPRIPISLELFSDVTRADTGCRILLPLLGPAVRACAGVSVGWWCLPGCSAVGLRSSEWTAGIEGRLVLPLGKLEGELGCALETVADLITVQPLGTERSSVQDRCLMLAVRLEPAVRIGFVDRSSPGRIRKTGLGVALAVEPPAWTVLPFVSSTAVGNNALALSLFAFGEIR